MPPCFENSGEIQTVTIVKTDKLMYRIQVGLTPVLCVDDRSTLKHTAVITVRGGAADRSPQFLAFCQVMGEPVVPQ